MSDEFNVEGRTFKDGHDPMWTALDKSDDDASAAGGGSLQFYNSSSVTTENGYLKIATTIGKTNWNRFDHVKQTWKHEQTNFTSGMVQSWEKFCFTGGIVEVDVIFPGDPYIGGLWPAVWMLGNLGRATYEASTNNIWPWSYDTCDRELQDAQTLSACNRENHFGMNPFQGRGATEIDLVEVMTGYSKKPLPGTNPPLNFPYGDLTLQVRGFFAFTCFGLFSSLYYSHFISIGRSWCSKESPSNGFRAASEECYIPEWPRRVRGANVVRWIGNARKHVDQPFLLRNLFSRDKA
jgi:Beta-glucan synthesis-associated protein SKN1/KRE6/Sbg1